MVSSARTRALIDHSSLRHSEIEQQSQAIEDQDNLLKDVAAAADICRCNPCRCDPLLNDCSVSCNPVVDASDPNQPATTTGGGCGCGCSKKEGAVANKTVRRMGGCGCNCGGGGASGASSSLENQGELNPSQLSVLPYHPQETSSCSQPSDSDPCCIVVCLKHLKRQFLIDRPKCCA